MSQTYRVAAIAADGTRGWLTFVELPPGASFDTETPTLVVRETLSAIAPEAQDLPYGWRWSPTKRGRRSYTLQRYIMGILLQAPALRLTAHDILAMMTPGVVAWYRDTTGRQMSEAVVVANLRILCAHALVTRLAWSSPSLWQATTAANALKWSPA